MIPQRFRTAEDAIAWYNGWLKTIPGPDEPDHCRMCRPRFNNWDPVVMWETQHGDSVFWYIVGTAGDESLVIEGEETIRGWGNQYYHYYSLVHGVAEAEAIMPRMELPVAPVPADLEPSTPESEYWWPTLQPAA